MDRNKFIHNFAHRLTQLMQEEGHESDRSKAKVDIKKLSKMSGCSYQMARKYALGLSLPEYHIIIKIADWLKTSPSWLLFGENSKQIFSDQKIGNYITVEQDLLKHILNKSCILFSIIDNKENLINFIVECIYDASHLNTDHKTVYKIIDMMFASAAMLNNYPKELKKICKNGI